MTAFVVGDEVFGVASKPFLSAGTFAERVVVDQSSIARKPASVDHAGASTAGLAAVTALTALEILEPKVGQTLLVVGASGGVGSYAVQLAAGRGASAIGVARADRAEYLRGLGASETVDYASTDVDVWVSSNHPGGVDALLDLASDGAGFVRLARRVKRGGRAATTATQIPPSDVEALAAQGVSASGVRAEATPERLASVANALARGALKLPRLRTVSLEQAGQVLAEAGSHHTQGKIVVSI